MLWGVGVGGCAQRAHSSLPPALDPLPPPSPQSLLRYLARLARYCDGCTAEGLASVLGPLLLEPESYGGGLPVDADSLTGAAIWVVHALIR